MEYLLVENESVIQLTGYLDASGALQFSHSSGNLVDNSDALQAEDEGSSIQIKLMDFTGGGSSWQVNASHAGTGGTVNWSRGTNHAQYTFTQYMTNFLEVSITASNGTTTKEKIIDTKTKPRGSLPDHPI
jgi:hypothetical protein